MGALGPLQIDFSLDLVRAKNAFPCLWLDTDLPAQTTYLKELSRHNQSMDRANDAGGVHESVPLLMTFLRQIPLMAVLYE
jgi:hypothetical protein